MSALNETWKYKDWAGIISPARYIENHVYEYTAFRQAAGLLDVSPLYKYEVSGPQSATFLSYVMSKDITKLKPGRVTYVCWCDDEGKVIDDGTVTCLAEGTYFVTAAEPQYAWFSRLARGFDVQLKDISREVAALALQGPTSQKILQTSVKFFQSTSATIGNVPVRISRTGYTGDLGYEVWCAWNQAEAVWDALMQAGQPHGIVPAGIDALDIARIEAGFIMLGVDYFAANHVTVPEKKSTPYELDLPVQLERGAFVGQKALRSNKGTRAVVGLELDWEQLEALYAVHDMPPQLPAGASRESLPIYASGRQIGRVSSSTWSPLLKKYIALGTVERGFASEGSVLEVEHTVMFARKTVKARVVKRPFFDPERKRA